MTLLLLYSNILHTQCDLFSSCNFCTDIERRFSNLRVVCSHLHSAQLISAAPGRPISRSTADQPTGSLHMVMGLNNSSNTGRRGLARGRKCVRHNHESASRRTIVFHISHKVYLGLRRQSHLHNCVAWLHGCTDIDHLIALSYQRQAYGTRTKCQTSVSKILHAFVDSFVAC